MRYSNRSKKPQQLNSSNKRKGVCRKYQGYINAQSRTIKDREIAYLVPQKGIKQ